MGYGTHCSKIHRFPGTHGTRSKGAPGPYAMSMCLSVSLRVRKLAMIPPVVSKNSLMLRHSCLGPSAVVMYETYVSDPPSVEASTFFELFL